MSGRRLVTFAGETIEVIERDKDAARIAAFLFKRFPETSHGAPCVSLELAGDGAATFALWRDGSLVYRETAAAKAAQLLLAEAAHKFAVNCRSGLLLHAAAVARDGLGFLLPGPSGTGKSTLVAWLDHHGFGCLSDEMIALSEDGIGLIAFPRPICLEPDARIWLPDVLDGARRDGRLLAGQDVLMEAGRSPIPATPVPLHRVIFPRYARHAETELQPLSKAAAAMRLLRSVTNAPNQPDHGFAAIADLVRRAPAFELRYGAPGECGDALLGLLASIPGG